MTYRAGTIGFGTMGSDWARHLAAADRCELVHICELDPDRRQAAAALATHVSDNPADVLENPDIDIVGLFTLADHRPEQIRRALAAGKHIIAEKPIAPDLETESALLAEIEAGDRLVAVNLFNRNAWYHHEILAFIARGEIGQLGIVRVCHMTPGRLPGMGHGPEGPVFRDCGMHYVDVARWYAGSEYKRWNAQGVRMWSEPEPWWVTVHGEFENGIAFEVTNGFVYGQMAKDWTSRGYLEAIGTRGVARFHHNFKEIDVEMHGVSETIRKKGPYGGKKCDAMIDLFIRSLDAGRDLGLPTARDAVIASRVAQQMHDDAAAAGPPCIGGPDELDYVIANKPKW
ncbi:MAG: Gfo/Idh/MocA family protein [Lentisphaeria bacterium]